MAKNALVLACGLALAAPTLADEISLYHNDFDSRGLAGQGAKWSTNAYITEGPGVYTRFLGRFNNELVQLSIPAAPPVPPRQNQDDQPTQGGYGGGTNGDDDGGDDGGDGGGDGGGGGGGNTPDQFNLYTLTFDFYAIDSWDGSANAYGPDTLQLSINDAIVFSETFANSHLGQTFRAPDVGRSNLGFRPFDDAIYRDIAIQFTLDDEDEKIKLRWTDLGLQGMNDESWGIDNIRVSYEVVPAPTTASLLAIGSLGLTRRRR